MHAELRLDGDRAWVLELAARSIGGLCSRALRFGAGISLEEVILRHALRPRARPARRASGRPAGVMMLPIARAGTLREVRGLDAARAVAGRGGHPHHDPARPAGRAAARGRPLSGLRVRPGGDARRRSRRRCARAHASARRRRRLSILPRPWSPSPPTSSAARRSSASVRSRPTASSRRLHAADGRGRPLPGEPVARALRRRAPAPADERPLERHRPGLVAGRRDDRVHERPRRGRHAGGALPDRARRRRGAARVRRRARRRGRAGVVAGRDADRVHGQGGPRPVLERRSQAAHGPGHPHGRLAQRRRRARVPHPPLRGRGPPGRPAACRSRRATSTSPSPPGTPTAAGSRSPPGWAPDADLDAQAEHPLRAREGRRRGRRSWCAWRASPGCPRGRPTGARSRSSAPMSPARPDHAEPELYVWDGADARSLTGVARPARDARLRLRPARLDGARGAASALGRRLARRRDQPARPRRGVARAAGRRAASADARRHVARRRSRAPAAVS